MFKNTKMWKLMVRKERPRSKKAVKIRLKNKRIGNQSLKNKNQKERSIERIKNRKNKLRKKLLG